MQREKRLSLVALGVLLLTTVNSFGSIPPHVGALLSDLEVSRSNQQKLISKQEKTQKSFKSTVIFDLPLTYNSRVSYWINYFQTRGKTWFAEWLEKSTRYMPFVQKELRNYNLPQDLAFMVMIESGFEAGAKSHAGAVGPWQFIQTTGSRYGLKVLPWLDERKDLRKSTLAAIRYIRDLYEEFGSWYLVAASYNMGENGLRRKIQQQRTRDFWVLSHTGAIPQETIDYVPKILAAMIISKSPSLYGFPRIARLDPLEYEVIDVPGGTFLDPIADHIGVTRKHLRELNAELLWGQIPMGVKSHKIRVPRGSLEMVSQFTSVRNKYASGY